MKVLFLNGPYKSNFIRSARSTWPSISGSNWYPIFLAYATGWLLKHGHKAKLMDALVAGQSSQEVFDAAFLFKPNLLVLYVSTESLSSDLAIGVRIKKLTASQLILVGPWCSFEPEKILVNNPEVDGIVRREFDDVILDLANGKKKKLIKGLIYRDGETIISNPEREFLTSKQLDEFPFVTEIYKKFLPIKKYYQASLLHPFVDLFSGRGCIWGKCTFCLWPNTIHKGAMPYRARNVENVIEELKFIKKELPYVKEVFFQDDTLPSYRAREISERILKDSLKITWSCYVRANVDLDTLKLMKKAGCRYLHVGFESIDETILKNICKGTNPDLMKKFTEDTKKAGIRVHGDFIIGLPGETETTIKKTIDWAKKLGIEGYQFLIPQPFPKTPLYDFLKKNDYLTSKNEIDYPHLRHSELDSSRFRAMKDIYFTPQYISNTLKSTRSFDDFYRLLRTGVHVLPNIIRPKVQNRGLRESAESVKGNWEIYWRNYHGVTKIGAWSQRQALKSVFSLIIKEKIKKNIRIIDVGCGEGRTLLAFREYGFLNSIGIDNTHESLDICKKNGLTIGRDVYLKEAEKTSFKAREFDLVFSEGLLEHFTDPLPIIREMARISAKYIIIIQPNHYSLYGRVIAISGHLLRDNVAEHTFSRDCFVRQFKREAFILKREAYTPFREFFTLLFEKRNR